MYVVATDSQNVGGSTEIIFELVQPTPVDTHIIMSNAGSNTLLYTFYELISGVWTAMDLPNTDLNGSLAAGTNKQFTLNSSYNRVKLEGAASGGTLLQFCLTRIATRLAGGTIPVLNV